MMDDKLYEKDELPAVTKLSARTIEEEIRQGRFPKPRLASTRRVVWLASEIGAWMRSLPVADLPPPPNTGARKPRAAAPAPQASRQAA
jgi:prophage regulatory protein